MPLAAPFVCGRGEKIIGRIRVLVGLAGRFPREWFRRVEVHVVVDALALGLMAASVAFLGSLVVV
jgi:hypothetical protein